jgi:maleamate amidohydrolase
MKSERPWHGFVTERDRLVYEAAGYGKRIGFGSRPAVFVIDVQYNFVGDTPAPILQSIRTYRTSCGSEGWECVYKIQELLAAARSRNVPIFYTVSERRADLLDSGIQVGKSHRGMEQTSVAGTRATETVEEVASRPEDILISKRKPSAFFGTPLMSHLNFLDVDTIIVTGCTTSGCVRATAVDAYAYNFHTVVVEDCVFDRFQSSHAITLWDLNAKYADVVPMDAVKAYLESLPIRDTSKRLP